MSREFRARSPVVAAGDVYSFIVLRREISKLAALGDWPTFAITQRGHSANSVGRPRTRRLSGYFASFIVMYCAVSPRNFRVLVRRPGEGSVTTGSRAISHFFEQGSYRGHAA